MRLGYVGEIGAINRLFFGLVTHKIITRKIVGNRWLGECKMSIYICQLGAYFNLLLDLRSMDISFLLGYT